jgi:hypothetical protein
MAAGSALTLEAAVSEAFAIVFALATGADVP